MKKKEGTYTVIEILRDLFYCSGLTMYQLFRQATSAATMDLGEFTDLIHRLCSEQIPDTDI